MSRARLGRSRLVLSLARSLARATPACPPASGRRWPAVGVGMAVGGDAVDGRAAPARPLRPALAPALGPGTPLLHARAQGRLLLAASAEACLDPQRAVVQRLLLLLLLLRALVHLPPLRLWGGGGGAGEGDQAAEARGDLAQVVDGEPLRRPRGAVLVEGERVVADGLVHPEVLDVAHTPHLCLDLGVEAVAGDGASPSGQLEAVVSRQQVPPASGTRGQRPGAAVLTRAEHDFEKGVVLRAEESDGGEPQQRHLLGRHAQVARDGQDLEGGAARRGAQREAGRRSRARQLTPGDDVPPHVAREPRHRVRVGGGRGSGGAKPRGEGGLGGR
mmetsp:Transcript_37820/g.122968  ORF Transcript_37820/g.122968 Transcript_37820/m.122968 type:complete len:331 (+) Transcript_37820:373-1365(+)